MVFKNPFLQTQSRGPRRVFPRVKLKGILDVLGNMISYQVYLPWVVAKVFESQLVRGFCEIWNSGKQVITELAKFWIIASVGFSQKGEQPCCFFRSGLVFLELHIVLTRISTERMDLEGFGRRRQFNRELIQQVDSLSGQSGSLLAIVYRLHCKSTHMSFIRLFAWVWKRTCYIFVLPVWVSMGDWWVVCIRIGLHRQLGSRGSPTSISQLLQPP